MLKLKTFVQQKKTRMRLLLFEWVDFVFAKANTNEINYPPDKSKANEMEQEFTQEHFCVVAIEFIKSKRQEAQKEKNNTKTSLV